MTTGALLPAAAATTTSSFKPAASRHGRLPSQHDGVPSPSRLALWLVHLVRRSTVVQLVLALTACGSLLRLAVIHRADGAWNGTAEPGLSTLGGVLDIGGGDGSDLSKGRHPHQPQKAAAAAAGKDPIGIEVGWDFDGVYRVLTGGAEASTGSLSPLGPKADNSFQLLAPGDPDAYWQTLETFAQTAFPPTLAAQLLASLEAYRSEPDSPAAAAAAAPGPGMRDFPHIWQTAKVDQARDDGYWTEKNAGWDWSLLDDAEAAAWARAALSGEVEGDGAGVGDGAGATSAMREVWEKMGLSGKGGILRSDMLRYLLLLCVLPVGHRALVWPLTDAPRLAPHAASPAASTPTPTPSASSPSRSGARTLACCCPTRRSRAASPRSSSASRPTLARARTGTTCVSSSALSLAACLASCPSLTPFPAPLLPVVAAPSAIRPVDHLVGPAPPHLHRRPPPDLALDLARD